MGLLGLGVALLGWNLWTIETLKARVAVLEATRGTVSTEGSTTAGRAQQETASRTRERQARRKAEAASGSSSASQERAEERVGVAEAALLGLDDPEVKAAFDAYLNEFIEEKQEARSEIEESNYLDHMTTTVEVYCEEMDVPADVQERVVLRLEQAHEDWTGADAAHEAGEIDRREMLEVHGQIEEAVMTEMVELLGQENWETLAERIWG